MRLITAANAHYFGKIAPYLRSLSECGQPATLVCVGLEEYADPPKGIGIVRLPRAMNYGAPDETECPQHGSFLHRIEGPDDEVLIFTDGDIVMQRPFDADETALFLCLGENEVAAGYNSGPNETLAVEAARLFPRHPLAAIEHKFGLFDRPCYNIGVIAAQRQTWQAIYDEYQLHWDMVSKAFGHPARQQWLVNWVIQKLGMTVKVTPYSLHANGHYGMPPGCEYGVDGKLYHDKRLVCLKHKL